MSGYFSSGGDVHGVDEAEAFLDTALADEVFHGAGDIQVIAAVRGLKPKMFGKRFHGTCLTQRWEDAKARSVELSTSQRDIATLLDVIERRFTIGKGMSTSRLLN